ncbi:hypothetical protein INR49_022072 [Caranx melampygus]|nr:hypothetical protein INR49_022072 [Caranx melampygus]
MPHSCGNETTDTNTSNAPNSLHLKSVGRFITVARAVSLLPHTYQHNATVALPASRRNCVFTYSPPTLRCSTCAQGHVKAGSDPEVQASTTENTEEDVFDRPHCGLSSKNTTHSVDVCVCVCVCVCVREVRVQTRLPGSYVSWKNDDKSLIEALKKKKKHQ